MDRVVGINLRSSFVLGQLAARAMSDPERGGVILYTASICALGASTEDAHYGASKAGIVNLAKTMAIELVAKGIRVNTISPGPLDTPMSLALLGSEEAMRHSESTGPSCPWAASADPRRSRPARVPRLVGRLLPHRSQPCRRRRAHGAGLFDPLRAHGWMTLDRAASGARTERFSRYAAEDGARP